MRRIKINMTNNSADWFYGGVFMQLPLNQQVIPKPLLIVINT